MILMDHTGLTVEAFAELRSRLAKSKARAMVVKNSLLRLALKELALPDPNGALLGPTTVVYGGKEIAPAASALKNFAREFQKPRVKAAISGKDLLRAEQVEMIADLPPLEVLRAQLLGLLMAPATRLARLLNTPATQLAQVLKAKAEKTA